MTIPARYFIHTATLTHTIDAGAATTGEPLTAEATVTTVKCRYHPERTTFQNGVLTVVSARITLPPETIVSFGDTIVVTTKAFSTKTFTISADPKPVSEPMRDQLSHWSCEIMAAGVTGGS